MTFMPPRGGFGDVLFPSAKEVVLGLPLISTAHDVQRVAEVKTCKRSRAFKESCGVSDESSVGRIRAAAGCCTLQFYIIPLCVQIVRGIRSVWRMRARTQNARLSGGDGNARAVEDGRSADAKKDNVIYCSAAFY